MKTVTSTALTWPDANKPASFSLRKSANLKKDSGTIPRMPTPLVLKHVDASLKRSVAQQPNPVAMTVDDPVFNSAADDHCS